MERVGLGAGSETPLEAGRPRIVCCIEGNGAVGGTDTETLMLHVGETCLVPACRAASLRSSTAAT